MKEKTKKHVITAAETAAALPVVTVVAIGFVAVMAVTMAVVVGREAYQAFKSQN